MYKIRFHKTNVTDVKSGKTYLPCVSLDLSYSRRLIMRFFWFSNSNRFLSLSWVALSSRSSYCLERKINYDLKLSLGKSTIYSSWSPIENITADINSIVPPDAFKSIVWNRILLWLCCKCGMSQSGILTMGNWWFMKNMYFRLIYIMLHILKVNITDLYIFLRS